MKKAAALLMALALGLGLVACGAETSVSSSASGESPPQPQATGPGQSLPQSQPGETLAPQEESGKVLIAYFSRTGNTGAIAEMIEAQVGGDVVLLETVTPYPAEYNDVLQQARQEQQTNARPALATQIENMQDYSTVFVGYPIWHGDVPMAILSFLEGYDWEGKTVIPFCTHGSGGAYGSFESVANATPGAQAGEGFSIAGSAAEGAGAQVAEWLAGLGVAQSPKTQGEETKLRLAVGAHTLTATLAQNSSAEALAALLAEGPRTVAMQDYAGMEKVGDLGAALPTNDEQITTGPGDLILYGNSSFVIYYGENSWNLTRLGKIDDVTQQQLQEILGGGDVSVTLSLIE